MFIITCFLFCSLLLFDQFGILLSEHLCGFVCSIPKLVPDQIRRWRASRIRISWNDSTKAYIDSMHDRLLGRDPFYVGISGKPDAIDWTRVVEDMCASSNDVKAWVDTHSLEVAKHYFRTSFWKKANKDKQVQKDNVRVRQSKPKQSMPEAVSKE